MAAFASPLPFQSQKTRALSRIRSTTVAVDRAILSIDVGTSATKSGLFFPDERKLGTVYRQAHKTERKNGLIVQKKQCWLDATIATSRQALREDHEVVAVSVTGQMQDLIGVGDTPPLLKSDSILYSASVPEQADRLSKLSNTTLADTSIPAKLGLLTPGSYRLFLGAADFLTHALSYEKNAFTDATTVSTTSLTSAPHRTYNTELLKLLRQDAFLPQLPEILPSPAKVGTVSEEIALEINPHLQGIPIIHSGGDAFSATVGAGRDYVYGGTSGWIGRTLSSTAPTPHGILTLAHAMKREEMIAAGSVADVGGCIAHTAKILGCPPDEVGLLAKIGRPGVIYVPYLSGRRCPPGNGYGAWLRLRGDCGRAEMARAVVEGVVYALFAAGGEMDARDVVVVGGMVGCELFLEGIAALFDGCWIGERDIGVIGAGLIGAEVIGLNIGRAAMRRRVTVSHLVRERWETGYAEWSSEVKSMEGVWQ